MSIRVTAPAIVTGLLCSLVTVSVLAADTTDLVTGDSSPSTTTQADDKSRANATTPPAQTPGNDIVRLKSGAFFRGTIIELLPDDRVKILLPDGSTHTKSMSEVTYAGKFADELQDQRPQSDAPDSDSKTTRRHSKRHPGVDEVIVRAHSERLGLTLWAQNLDEDGDSEESCRIPCRLHLRRGRYRFALSEGDSEPYVFDGFELKADSTLNATWKSERNRRIGGWIVFGLGVASGISTLGAGVTYSAEGTNDARQTASLLYAASVGSFFIGGLALTLALTQDQRSILLLEDNERKNNVHSRKDIPRWWAAVGPGTFQIVGQF